ncbi:hypothetical protein [Halobacteriovorax sp.]|uniref:hypothetical protein n=1 Tax=Halobacteriovorax sp. TaxID=2020862 RepID=UPI003564ED0C
MVLSKYIVLFFLLITSVSAEVKLPEISTKQATNNLRFISKDGKFSYYQRRSGSLLLSTNYNVEEVLKGKEGSQYKVTSSPSQKFQLIEQNENFHTYLSIRKLNNIYISNYGEKKIRKIGEGVDARLHLNDSWVSFFNPYKMIISFIGLRNLGSSFEIKLQNTKNPYFIPQRVMLNDKSVLFTDLNGNAISGLIEFNRNTGKSDLLLKAENEYSKYELCTHKEKLYIGSFGIRSVSKYSSITQYSRKNFQISKGSIIYDSKYNDRGSIICNSSDDNIYFIQNTKGINGEESYEAASLDPKTKKVSTLSNFKWVSSIINMDDRLILPYHGKFYLMNPEKVQKTNDSLLNKNKGAK